MPKSKLKLNNKLTKNLVSLSGGALLSTIKTMETMGSIGREVLKANGISELQVDKQYPYEIRSAIHQAVFDKYGEIALIMMGHLNADSLIDSAMIQPILTRANRLDKLFDSVNQAEYEGALAEIVDLYIKGSDDQIKLFTSGGTADYGTNGRRLSPTSWEVNVTMAMDLFQEPFLRGTIDYIFTRSVGKYYQLELAFKKEKSSSGYGYATWCWHFNFSRQVSPLTSYEIFVASSNELREKLMKVVLDDATDKSKKMERVSKEIAKYIPPQIHSAIFSGEYDTRIATRRKKLTIFFSDIVNFTSTSEGLQPEDLTNYLNEYFSEMTTIAIEGGGTIDKYIGDAMMVFFGDPKSNGEKEDARACVDMALRMQDRMVDLRKKWKKEGFADPFQVRMGLNTGYCNVGNFGSEQRLTYTIIGGEVNVAQRLEANAKAGGILLSYETYAHAQDMIEAEEQDTIEMKGISREIKVFSIKGRKSQLLKKQIEEKIVSKKEENLIRDLKNTIVDLKKESQNLKQEMADLKKKILPFLRDKIDNEKK